MKVLCCIKQKFATIDILWCYFYLQNRTYVYLALGGCWKKREKKDKTHKHKKSPNFHTILKVIYPLDSMRKCK